MSFYFLLIFLSSLLIPFICSELEPIASSKDSNSTLSQDFCLSQPCKNNGTCVGSESLYFCICPFGFTGWDCSKPINFCQNPISLQDNNNYCNYYGTCKYDSYNGTYCVCNIGYTGFNCSTRICPIGYADFNCNLLGNDCPNQIYINKIGYINYTSFDCKCTNGSCKIENSDPTILNGENCMDIYNSGNRSCYCKNSLEKFGDRFCRKSYYILPCSISSSNPCSNESNCISYWSRGFFIPYCICSNNQSQCFKNSTSLPYLQTYPIANPCLLNSCSSGSKCLTYESSYTCECNGQVGGLLCFKSENLCSRPENQCQNGGICVVTIFNNTYCICPLRTTGPKCELINDCFNPLYYGHADLEKYCKFNSTCVESADDYFYGRGIKCICPPGFTGKYCDDCLDSSICLNGGKCSRDPRTANVTCSCPYGYTGAYCETKIIEFCEFRDDFVCDSNGICSIYKSYYCNCNNNKTICEKQICTFDRGCLNTGETCKSRPDMNSYGCTCGLYGQPLKENKINGACAVANSNTCETKITDQTFNGYYWTYNIAKINNSCINGAQCFFGLRGYNEFYVYLCECLSKSVQCTNTFDPCSLNLCNDNATCLAHSYEDRYYCRCNDNTKGICVKPTNPCYINPCMNEGLCLAYVKNWTNHILNPQIAKCECPKGTYGEYCENVVNYCTNNFCGSKGTCIMVGVEKFTCKCNYGYTGRYCDRKIEDLCSSNPCMNNGTCLVKDNSSICICHAEFSGKFCESLLASFSFLELLFILFKFIFESIKFLFKFFL